MNLTELAQRAKNLFRRPDRNTDVITQDRWDVGLFNEIREEVPKIDDLIRDLQRKHNYTEDLVRDMCMLFYQAAPQIRPQNQMDPSRLLNHAVLTSVEQAPETLVTRQNTRHDKYGTALGVLSVAQQIRDLLDQPPQDEAQEAGDDASDAEDFLSGVMKGLDGAGSAGESAQQAVEEAAAGLGQVMGDYEGEGPLTEPQADAQAALEAAQAHAEAMAKALEEAIAAAEDAQASADAARADAEHKADVARDHLDVPIRLGIQSASQELDQEAALMRSWGVNPGTLARGSYAEREALTRRLRNNRMAKYVDILGRFRMTASASQVEKTDYGMDEFFTTELSGDIDRILDESLAMLGMDGDEGLELLQMQALIDLVEEELPSRKYRGVERVGKGALVVLVDTSGSMKSTDASRIPREVWAKAFAMALLEVAEHGKRDFVGIHFASRTEQQVFYFPKGAGDLDQRLAFCDEFYNGAGTHFEKPIDMAIEIIRKQFNADGKPKADIVLITDDEYKMRDATWMETYLAAKKELAFRFYGITVGITQPGSALVALSQGGGNVRAVTEFVNPEVVLDIMQTT